MDTWIVANFTAIITFSLAVSIYVFQFLASHSAPIKSSIIKSLNLECAIFFLLVYLISCLAIFMLIVINYEFYKDHNYILNTTSIIISLIPWVFFFYIIFKVLKFQEENSEYFDVISKGILEELSEIKKYFKKLNDFEEQLEEYDRVPWNESKANQNKNIAISAGSSGIFMGIENFSEVISKLNGKDIKVMVKNLGGKVKKGERIVVIIKSEDAKDSTDRCNIHLLIDQREKTKFMLDCIMNEICINFENSLTKGISLWEPLTHAIYKQHNKYLNRAIHKKIIERMTNISLSLYHSNARSMLDFFEKIDDFIIMLLRCKDNGQECGKKGSVIEYYIKGFFHVYIYLYENSSLEVQNLITEDRKIVLQARDILGFITKYKTNSEENEERYDFVNLGIDLYLDFMHLCFMKGDIKGFQIFSESLKEKYCLEKCEKDVSMGLIVIGAYIDVYIRKYGKNNVNDSMSQINENFKELCKDKRKKFSSLDKKEELWDKKTINWGLYEKEQLVVQDLSHLGGYEEWIKNLEQKI